MAKALNDPELLAQAKAALGEAGDGLFSMNFSFLGIDLSATPNWRFWQGGLNWGSIGLFLLPLISVVASFLSMKISMATNKMTNQAQSEQVDKNNQMMMWMMPLMSLWIGFTLPAALCVYWIAQYVVTMVQEIICGKLLKKDYEAAAAAAEEHARQMKEEERQRKEEARQERARRIEEEKKNKGKKAKSAQKKKDEEPAQAGVNKDDSREGLRAYARGRAYIPDRFGGVTPYTDPNALTRAPQQTDADQGKKEEKAEPTQQQEETAPTPAGEPDKQVAPAPAAAEMEEVEVEAEEIEVEVSED
jgi:YidC/Oxa1 family membrane protein insertase